MNVARRHLPPSWAMMLALVAVGVNLRTVMASLPPLVETITGDLHLSNAAVGALTTLPVLCMGLFAPLAQRVAVRIGSSAAVELAAVSLVVGIGLRVLGDHLWALYAGTFVAGVGVAVAGTLLPGLVKELFPPQRLGFVTGLYMFSMMGGAALSAALSVPLRRWLGSWQGSLGSWSLLAVVGALAWAPVALGHRRHLAANPVDALPARLPWRHPTAWLVAGYLAVQSWEFYSSMAWLAPTYVDAGWDATHAGYLLSVFSAAQLVSGLVGPTIADRVHDHRVLLVTFAVISLLGQASLWLLPHGAPWVWAAVLGLGQGASFSLGVVLMVDFTTTPAASARLAGMAFFISYSLASVGPTTMGVVRDLTGGFSGVWMALTLLMFAQLGLAFCFRPDLRRVE